VPKPDREQLIDLLLASPSAEGLTRDQVAAWVDHNVEFDVIAPARGFRLIPNPTPPPRAPRE
jgi:hypothetical protein